MTVSLDYFSGIAQELLGKINRVCCLIKNSNLKSGEYHEEIVRHFLRGFMTKRYALKTGYIYLDAETTSRQVDILVIDEHIPFTYLFQEGDFVVVRPEPVIAVIEIKTRLNLGEFRGAFENIVTAKRIKQKSLGYYGHIFGAVFGFFSNKVIDKYSLNTWFRDGLISKHASDEGAIWPDEIFFFDKLTLLRQETPAPDKKGNYFYQPIYPSIGADYKALQLALLAGILFSVCDSEDQNQKGRFPTFDLDTFMKFEAVITGSERFSPGEGLWPEEE
jgi:hypothetical protein